MEKKATASSPPAAWSRTWRAVKTIFFLFSMVGSLLVFSAPPLLVAILDIVLPTAVLNAHSSTPLSIRSVAVNLRGFDFSTSLVDVPLVSVARSLLILCVYSVCDVPGRSRGPYLGVALFCSMVSAAYVAAKAFVVSGGLFRWRAGAEGSGVEAVMVMSMLLAAAHVLVAYKTSCRERRKLHVYRIDLEAVPLSNIGFDYYKSYK